MERASYAMTACYHTTTPVVRFLLSRPVMRKALVAYSLLSAPFPLAAQVASGPGAPSVPGSPARIERAETAAIDLLGTPIPLPTSLLPDLDPKDVRWDIDVVTYASHPRVQYYLRYFQGTGRDRMAQWLERGAGWTPFIRDRFAKEQLPADLGYLALIESGYSSTAVSRAGAVGMWQFMPGTARDYGLRVDRWVDERRDPVKATDAAARHLKDLSDRFGSPYLAAAAYNAGAGRLTASLGRLGTMGGLPTPPIADSSGLRTSLAQGFEFVRSLLGAPGDESARKYGDATLFKLSNTALLPTETTNYVPQLIAAAIIAKQPARYGFDLPAVATPHTWDSVVVTRSTPLDAIARHAGVSEESIRALNPQYLRGVTPPGTTSLIRVPVSSGPRVSDALALDPQLPEPADDATDFDAVAPRVRTPRTGALAPTTRVAFADTRQVRVKRGDTIESLAREHGVAEISLRKMNALPKGYAMKPGQIIRVPAID